MRTSQLLLPTLREDPGEAETISHRLMLRAGLIRKVAAGIYTYLPLGLRIIRKVENIIREEMNRAGAQELHRSPMLTILHIVWPPSFTQTPHNHLLWAELGVYSGREDNIFWRRCASGSKWTIEATGGASMCAGTCLSLERDVIHSVTNPLDIVTASLHVYGGDLVSAARSMWDGETLVEAPLDYQVGRSAA